MSAPPVHTCKKCDLHYQSSVEICPRCSVSLQAAQERESQARRDRAKAAANRSLPETAYFRAYNFAVKYSMHSDHDEHAMQGFRDGLSATAVGRDAKVASKAEQAAAMDQRRIAEAAVRKARATVLEEKLAPKLARAKVRFDKDQAKLPGEYEASTEEAILIGRGSPRRKQIVPEVFKARVVKRSDTHLWVVALIGPWKYYHKASPPGVDRYWLKIRFTYWRPYLLHEGEPEVDNWGMDHIRNLWWAPSHEAVAVRDARIELRESKRGAA